LSPLLFQRLFEALPELFVTNFIKIPLNPRLFLT
jgi:hypothetical protein